MPTSLVCGLTRAALRRYSNCVRGLARLIDDARQTRSVTHEAHSFVPKRGKISAAAWKSGMRARDCADDPARRFPLVFHRDKIAIIVSDCKRTRGAAAAAVVLPAITQRYPVSDQIINLFLLFFSRKQGQGPPLNTFWALTWLAR